MSENNRPETWLSRIAIDCFDQISTTNIKVKSSDCLPHGLYPVIDQGHNYISGYINDENKLIKITSPVCIFGDHTRIIKWIEHSFVPGADGTKILKARDFIYPRYAYYSLRALNIPDKGYSRHFKYFKELDILIPAWEEQKIIAEKLDTLLAQVDSTKARLEQIPKILKRFRQAVLVTALSIANGKSRDFDRIVKLIDVAEKITDGEHITPKTVDAGIPLLSAKDVQENELLFDNVKYLSNATAEKALSRCSPGKDDILIVSRGATVGRTHLVSTNAKFCLMGSVLLIKLNKNLVLPRFMELVFKNISGQRQLVSASGATAQQAIYIRDVKEFSFNLLSLNEQQEIVRRVEQLFAYADTIEKQVNNALARVNNLTQSILAKAFRGELTAQWRAENPQLISGENSAAALLEKIKAERAASTGKKASRKKS